MASLNIFLLIISGVFGAVIGSFLNVVILRIPEKKSLVPSSSCQNCGHKLGVLENIPILSWIFLLGKCKNCSKPISIQYPLVEFATAALFVMLTFKYLLPIETISPANSIFYIAILYLAAISIALFVIDIRVKLLPDSIVLPSYLVAVVLLVAAKLFAGNPEGIPWILLGAVISFLFYFLLSIITAAVGGGDVKLSGALGLYLGYFGLGHVFLGLLGSFILAGFYAVILLALKKATGKTEVAFGPWMLISAFISIIFGAEILRWYLDFFPAITG